MIPINTDIFALSSPSNWRMILPTSSSVAISECADGLNLLRLSDNPNSRDEDDLVADAAVNVNADADLESDVDLNTDLGVCCKLSSQIVEIGVCCEIASQNGGIGHLVQQKQTGHVGALWPPGPFLIPFFRIQWL